VSAKKILESLVASADQTQLVDDLCYDSWIEFQPSRNGRDAYYEGWVSEKDLIEMTAEVDRLKAEGWNIKISSNPMTKSHYTGEYPDPTDDQEGYDVTVRVTGPAEVEESKKVK